MIKTVLQSVLRIVPLLLLTLPDDALALQVHGSPEGLYA